MTQAKKKTVTITDIGPVAVLEIPIPEEGGIVVLQGPNGAGKTRALEAVQRLVTGKGTLDVRDRALAGKVQGLGCELVVGKRTSQRGTLEVHGLLGVDPSLLIEPGVKDPKARDAKRLEILCHLSKADVPLETFGALVPGGMEELRQIAKATSLMPDLPLPTRAAALKRDLQSKAREVEEEEQRERGRSLGLREGLEGVDLDAPSDEKAVREAVSVAVRDLSVLQTRRQACDLAKKTAAENREKLEKAKAEFRGIPADRAAEFVADAESKVAHAKETFEAAVACLASARGALSESKTFEKTIAGWMQTLAAADAQGDGPSDEEIAAAEAKVAEAHAQADLAARIRDAKAKADQADQAAERSEELAARAKDYRTAAEACEGVLTAAIAEIAPAGLRMKDERMVLETKRGETLYDELSFGERSRIAVEIAAKAVGSEGLLVLAQEFWEGLDPMNAKELDTIAKGIPCVILTARATDGELRAGVLA